MRPAERDGMSETQFAVLVLANAKPFGTQRQKLTYRQQGSCNHHLGHNVTRSFQCRTRERFRFIVKRPSSRRSRCRGSSFNGLASHCRCLPADTSAFRTGFSANCSRNPGTHSSPFALQPPLYCWNSGPDLYVSSGASLGQMSSEVVLAL